MAYAVSITPRAERDLALLYEEINAASFDAALTCLAEMPYRCPKTPESNRLRHLLYGNKPHVYRVIYRILEKPKRVEVLHIRHGARRRFTTSGP